MPRVSKTWSYEKSKRRYVANINKEKRVLLAGVDRTKENDDLADRLYAEERALAAVEVTGDRTAIKVALSDWLRWLRERPNPVTPGTFVRCQRIVWSFTDQYGDLAGRDVTPQHIEKWLATQREARTHPVNGRLVRWNEATIRTALHTMRSAFRYCADRKLVSNDPFSRPGALGLRLGPDAPYEGSKVHIEQKEYEALVRWALARANKDLAILLMLLWNTGARPSELLAARAEEWRPKERAFFIEASDRANVGRHKQMRFKKDRIVYVPDAMVPFVELLIEKYKDAPKFPANFHSIVVARKSHQRVPSPMREVSFLFRAERNRSEQFPADRYGPLPLTVPHLNRLLDSHIRLINAEAGTEVIRPNITSYSFRHAYVTNWVITKNGNDLKMLAQLLGTSVRMIEKHYTHLLREHDTMRNVLNSFEDARSRARPPE
jgi:integrase